MITEQQQSQLQARLDQFLKKPLWELNAAPKVLVERRLKALRVYAKPASGDLFPLFSKAVSLVQEGDHLCTQLKQSSQILLQFDLQLFTDKDYRVLAKNRCEEIDRQITNESAFTPDRLALLQRAKDDANADALNFGETLHECAALFPNDPGTAAIYQSAYSGRIDCIYYTGRTLDALLRIAINTIKYGLIWNYFFYRFILDDIGADLATAAARRQAVDALKSLFLDFSGSLGEVVSKTNDFGDLFEAFFEKEEVAARQARNLQETLTKARDYAAKFNAMAYHWCRVAERLKEANDNILGQARTFIGDFKPARIPDPTPRFTLFKWINPAQIWSRLRNRSQSAGSFNR